MAGKIDIEVIGGTDDDDVEEWQWPSRGYMRRDARTPVTPAGSGGLVDYGLRIREGEGPEDSTYLKSQTSGGPRLEAKVRGKISPDFDKFTGQKAQYRGEDRVLEDLGFFNLNGIDNLGDGGNTKTINVHVNKSRPRQRSFLSGLRDRGNFITGKDIENLPHTKKSAVLVRGGSNSTVSPSSAEMKKIRNDGYPITWGEPGFGSGEGAYEKRTLNTAAEVPTGSQTKAGVSKQKTATTNVITLWFPARGNHRFVPRKQPTTDEEKQKLLREEYEMWARRAENTASFEEWRQLVIKLSIEGKQDLEETIQHLKDEGKDPGQIEELKYLIEQSNEQYKKIADANFKADEDMKATIANMAKIDATIQKYRRTGVRDQKSVDILNEWVVEYNKLVVKGKVGKEKLKVSKKAQSLAKTEGVANATEIITKEAEEAGIEVGLIGDEMSDAAMSLIAITVPIAGLTMAVWGSLKKDSKKLHEKVVEESKTVDEYESTWGEGTTVYYDPETMEYREEVYDENDVLVGVRIGDKYFPRDITETHEEYYRREEERDEETPTQSWMEKIGLGWPLLLAVGVGGVGVIYVLATSDKEEKA